MKYISIFLLLIGICSCQPKTHIFIVRHAEKIDNSRDPELSESGKMRSANLAIILKKEHITEVYSTNYKRTLQTAQPICDLIGGAPIIYTPDSLNYLAAKLISKMKPILVVGHSNSTLSLLDAMGIQHSMKVISDDDYSNLFKVTISKKGKKKRLEELKF
ncbi:MAG: histidine phosphatase family protein [Saprospiraceae bacterium]|nr:histidine phosphatase family protein [Saprospiraceae bacterium]